MCFSCEQPLETELINERNGYLKSSEADFTLKRTSNYRIYCEGPCDCGLEGVVGGYVQCKCDDCVMIIEETSATDKNSTKLNTFTLENAKLEIPYINDFHDHITKEFGKTSNVRINLIEAQFLNGMEAYRYEFTINNSVEDDVIIVAERSGDIYTISCDGSCDCRSKFVFSSPPAATCSCDDCIMTVTEK